MLSNLTRGGTDSSLIARYSTLPYLLSAIFTVIVGVEFGPLERKAGPSCRLHGTGGCGVRVGGGCEKYSCGVVCDVAGGDWTV